MKRKQKWPSFFLILSMKFLSVAGSNCHMELEGKFNNYRLRRVKFDRVLESSRDIGEYREQYGHLACDDLSGFKER